MRLLAILFLLGLGFGLIFDLSFASWEGYFICNVGLDIRNA